MKPAAGVSLDERDVLARALALALAACVSLGLARFSYALLLPPMRDDLGWSYFTAGAMNTANAAGYLAGALLTPRLLRRVGTARTLLAGTLSAALLLALHAATRSDALLLAARFATGVASAAVFMAGGVLAAQLAGAGRAGAGLVLGIYYGGTGLGIVASALLVPPIVAAPLDHAWAWGWVALGAAALLCTAPMLRGARAGAAIGPTPGVADRSHGFAWRRLACALGAYLLFGVGYIGYMTFVVTLLREQGLAEPLIVAFYILLGAGVIGSSWLWAGLLQRHRGGGALARLNALLALATVLPVLSAHPLAIFASGALFGGVFLSVVASTTALVRHNLAPAAWPAGIGAFTAVFAAGQIAGPVLVGRVADGPGGLARGFVVSAAVLAFAALLAALQRPLANPNHQEA